MGNGAIEGLTIGADERLVFEVSHTNDGKVKSRIFARRSDHSLVFDFVESDGKTARYTVNAETLTKLGVLERFDSDPFPGGA